jgi:hypothetical protein
MKLDLCGINNIRKIIDDVVVFDQDKAQHMEHVHAILHRCQEKGISLNHEKFRFNHKRPHIYSQRLPCQ